MTVKCFAPNFLFLFFFYTVCITTHDTHKLVQKKRKCNNSQTCFFFFVLLLASAYKLTMCRNKAFVYTNGIWLRASTYNKIREKKTNQTYITRVHKRKLAKFTRRPFSRPFLNVGATQRTLTSQKQKKPKNATTSRYLFPERRSPTTLGEFTPDSTVPRLRFGRTLVKSLRALQPTDVFLAVDTARGENDRFRRTVNIYRNRAPLNENGDFRGTPSCGLKEGGKSGDEKYMYVMIAAARSMCDRGMMASTDTWYTFGYYPEQQPEDLV